LVITESPCSKSSYNVLVTVSGEVIFKSNTYTFELYTASNITCSTKNATSWNIISIYKMINGTSIGIAILANNGSTPNVADGYTLTYDYTENVVDIKLQYNNVSCSDQDTIYCGLFVRSFDDPVSEKHDSTLVKISGKKNIDKWTLIAFVHVGSRIGFERDFTIGLIYIEGIMEERFKCLKRPLVKYRKHQKPNTCKRSLTAIV